MRTVVSLDRYVQTYVFLEQSSRYYMYVRTSENSTCLCHTKHEPCSESDLVTYVSSVFSAASSAFSSAASLSSFTFRFPLPFPPLLRDERAD